MSRRRPSRRPTILADRKAPRSYAPAPMSASCWKCDGPALTGRAVCQDCADRLERTAARLRKRAPNTRPEELLDAA